MLANDIGPEIDTAAGRIEEKLVAIRRDIHAHPETGFDTIRTSALVVDQLKACLLYTSPSPRDKRQSRMPSSA